MTLVRTISLVALYLSATIVHGLPSQLLNPRAALLPEDDPFYVPPPGFEDSAPGTILRHRNTPAPIAAFGFAPVNLDGAYQLLYRSSDNFGRPAATVSTVLIPHGADFSKVLSYQFAEDAASPNCAPSYALQKGSESGGHLGTATTHAEFILVMAALERGWVVTAPDFEGSNAAFLANLRAGYATLDGIRATLASKKITGVSKEATVAMWGYSGGSLASGFAAELQPSYAPELKIVGAALGGTVPNIKTALAAINKGDSAGLIPAGILGLAHEYPEIQAIIDEQIVAEKREEFLKAEVECLNANRQRFDKVDIYTYIKGGEAVLNSPTVNRVLAENSMGQHTPEIPLLVYKAVRDEISWVNDTTALVNKYCNEGASVDYRLSKSGGHIDLAVIAAPDALLWLDKRFRHITPQKGCVSSTRFTPLESPWAFAVLTETLANLLLNILHKPIGN
ncbi:hypothetical protein GX50_02464 [[Emmonsia] crescens]|uniref:Secretory lipase n=1 Tax=[Emmonsia] crescens TaxID=73230 RepID=A0A2B7ZL29_9EURO|nr:hypothetical protein GX50_02464 [Emmonsia crescens]